MSKPVLQDIFKFNGRRNRKSYFLYLLLYIIAWAGVVFIAVLTYVGWILVIPLIISGWAVAAQRCRDFGWTGWAALLALIPYVGFLFSLAILFVPGNVGANRYGPDFLEDDNKLIDGSMKLE